MKVVQLLHEPISHEVMTDSFCPCNGLAVRIYTANVIQLNVIDLVIMNKVKIYCLV